MKFGNVLIFGDSYSTFKGWVPKGNAVYYPPIIEGRPKITEVSDTWWHAFINETDSALVLNESWSGSTIGYTGYGGADTSKTSSFITRLRKMRSDGFFEKNKIDTVFVFGATNDSWSDAPIGKNKYTGRSESDLYFVLPAICAFLEELKEVLPKAKTVFIINCGLKEEIISGIKRACKHYSAKTVFLSEIDKKADHPTVLGMTQIKNQILKKLT